MHFLLTPRTRSARHSNGFQTPPLDGSLTISELYDFHLENNPTHPVFIYANEANNLVRLSFSEVVPAAHSAARLVARRANIDLEGQNSPVTIAILATTDTITYFTILLGMMRAGITVFVISPRNSAPAVAHLLSKIQPSHILVSPDTPMQELARNAIKALHDHIPIVLSMLVYEEIFIRGIVHIPLPPRHRDLSVARIIVHTSGTTSFPKPIIWNDRSYLQVAVGPLLGAHELCGEIISCHALTMFHAMGLNFIAWLASTGLIMSTFQPVSPSVVPTPEAVWNGSVNTSPSYLLAPPIFFEDWSRDSDKLSFLKQLKAIAYGGAPLQKAVGNYLANQGVIIQMLYGSTEVGVCGTVFPENPGLDWEYVSINPHCAVEFVPLHDGTYELVAVAKPTTELTVINSTLNGMDAYASNDILTPHPTIPGKWKILGRKDDQIMLSSGEKTNPGPLEAILCQHPHVASAVMFGRGRFQNGVLIKVKDDYVFDPNDLNKLEAFRASIWPQVKQLNDMAPAHSRLFKEMIMIANPSKPFAYGPKGAPKRTVILNAYSAEIDALYDAVEKGISVIPPVEWTHATSLAFVREIVNGVLRHPAKDFEDIFECGCDSLQAMWIKQSLTRAPSTSHSSTLPSNLVYQHPTISRLSEQFMLLMRNSTNEMTSRVKILESFSIPYTSTFPTHKWDEQASEERVAPPDSRDIVLITGTTGALGSAILAKLVSSDNVGRIYALNRKSKQGICLLERQKKALSSRGYDPNIVLSPRVVLVEGDLMESGLEISHVLKEEIRTSVTHILHVAWRVDFNLSLESFERAIGGTRALVDFALSSPKQSPPRFLFTSSIGIFRSNLPDYPIPELPVSDPTVPLGQGYAESKWVAEKMLFEAAKVTPLRPIVVRIGQVSGGLNGSWNTSDCIPAIIKSSLEMNVLPELKGTCSWIPLDFAAEALAELRSAEPQQGVVHLTHPQPIPCRDVVKVISEELGLPLLPLKEWVKVLENCVASSPPPEYRFQRTSYLDTLPAFKTLDFFRSASRQEGDTRDAMGVPLLDIKEALAGSSALRQDGLTKKITSGDIRLWLKYWMTVKFI